MNVSHFIAKRISFSGHKSFTGIIVRIAILAIALSLAVMIISSAIITGFKNEISDKVIAFWGDIHINDAGINRTFEQLPISDYREIAKEMEAIQGLQYLEDRSIFGIPLSFLPQKYKTTGGVSSAQGTVMVPGLIRTRKYFNGIILKGIGDDFDWERMKRFIVEGTILNLADTISDGILLSRAVAEKLEITVGENVIVSFIKDKNHIRRRFTIQGIYNTGLEEYDSKLAIADIRKVREVIGWYDDQAGSIELVLDRSKDAELISDYIYYDLLPDHLYAMSIQQKFPNIFEWLKLQEINERIILGLMIIVGIINMLTVLFILILERSRMIGVLKALGAGNQLVRRVFLYNAGYMITFGLLIGNILGLGFCYLQKKYEIITLDEKSYYLSVAPVELDWIFLGVLNIATFLIILGVMIIPTVLIAYIHPVKVLRFE